jgi:hypothetical protein
MAARSAEDATDHETTTTRQASLSAEARSEATDHRRATATKRSTTVTAPSEEEAEAMLTIPAIVVNCDTCPRGVTKSTWDGKAAVVSQLEGEGWKIGKTTRGTEPNPAKCPECAAKVKV